MLSLSSPLADVVMCYSPSRPQAQPLAGPQPGEQQRLLRQPRRALPCCTRATCATRSRARARSSRTSPPVRHAACSCSAVGMYLRGTAICELQCCPSLLSASNLALHPGQLVNLSPRTGVLGGSTRKAGGALRAASTAPRHASHPGGAAQGRGGCRLLHAPDDCLLDPGTRSSVVAAARQRPLLAGVFKPLPLLTWQLPPYPKVQKAQLLCTVQACKGFSAHAPAPAAGNPAPELHPIPSPRSLAQKAGSTTSRGTPRSVTGQGKPSGGPQMLCCYLCGSQFGSRSLMIHIKQCQSKWDANVRPRGLLLLSSQLCTPACT